MINLRLVVFSCAFIAAHAAFTCAPANDVTICNALSDFYTSLGGSGWTNQAGWSAAASGVPTDYKTFTGLTFNAAGALSTLILTNNNLVGTIPDSIGNLVQTATTTFKIGDGSSTVANNGNNICGYIPAALVTWCKANAAGGSNAKCSIWNYVNGANQVQFSLKSCTPVPNSGGFTCLATDNPDLCYLMWEFLTISKFDSAELRAMASGYPGI